MAAKQTAEVVDHPTRKTFTLGQWVRIDRPSDIPGGKGETLYGFCVPGHAYVGHRVMVYVPGRGSSTFDREYVTAVEPFEV